MIDPDPLAMHRFPRPRAARRDSGEIFGQLIYIMEKT
jgi:hypothetical protein